ncbi:MAG: zinc ribbon domain regulatory protein CdsZ [Parachlamydiaceae bacterium]
MFKSLAKILDIQELDMQMIQLMRLKNERKRELEAIHHAKESLRSQIAEKHKEIQELGAEARFAEGVINEIVEKAKKLESQQNLVKKVEEFNSLSQEMAQTDRKKLVEEQRLSDLLDRIATEEDALKSLTETLETTTESHKILEAEIREGILRINEEGRTIKSQRDEMVAHADPEIFKIYERLLKNKKDRVVVPIENRCCSGCHIMLTAQDENLVRKGERIVFCEHCSRIHYWQESQVPENSTTAPKPRRRRAAKVTS